MKKLLLATAAVAALTASVPASAQVSDILRRGIESILGGGGSANIEVQLRDLNSRIQAGYQRGVISQSEASRLQNELRSITQLEQEYRTDGLSRSERDDLQQRLRSLEDRIQQAGNIGNRDRRYTDRDGRYDRDDSYNRDDRDDDDLDNDGDRDRDDASERDGRWSDNDGRNGRDCPPGLAKKHNGCLPPGQAKRMGDRYTNQYGSVPTMYGKRFRDTQK